MAIVMFCGAAWKLQCIKWEYLNDLKYYVRFTWSMNTVDSSTVSDMCLYL